MGPIDDLLYGRRLRRPYDKPRTLPRGGDAPRQLAQVCRHAVELAGGVFEPGEGDGLLFGRLGDGGGAGAVAIGDAGDTADPLLQASHFLFLIARDLGDPARVLGTLRRRLENDVERL